VERPASEAAASDRGVNESEWQNNANRYLQLQDSSGYRNIDSKNHGRFWAHKAGVDFAITVDASGWRWMTSEETVFFAPERVSAILTA